MSHHASTTSSATGANITALDRVAIDETQVDLEMRGNTVTAPAAGPNCTLQPNTAWRPLEIAQAFGDTTWSERLDAYVSELHFNLFSRTGPHGKVEWCEPDFILVRTHPEVGDDVPRGRFFEMRSEDYLRGHADAGGSRYTYDRRKGFWRCLSAETVAREDFGFSYHVVTDFASISHFGGHES